MDEHGEEMFDAAGFVAEWWSENPAHLLPGEGGETTVFTVEFQDGCRYLGYTSGAVFVRLCELMGSPFDRGSNTFVREHCQLMAYLVHCVSSGLDRRSARGLRDRLVSQAPGDVYAACGTAVTTSDCLLRAGETEVEVISFAEWTKERDAQNGRDPK